jgi:hypothetical protein
VAAGTCEMGAPFLKYSNHRKLALVIVGATVMVLTILMIETREIKVMNFCSVMKYTCTEM